MSRYRYCPVCSSALIPGFHGGRERLGCSNPHCGFVHWDNPTPVVGAIAERDGVVIQVRSHGWPAGWYGLITGFLEAAETPEEGVLREVEEEIGLAGAVVGLVGLYPFERMNQILMIYHVELGDGEVVLDSAELDGWRSVPFDELHPWASGTGYALRDWMAQRGRHFADDELLQLSARGR
ncbi:MAG: NUDIX domain-containing protein [Pseudomonadota bacterium]